MIYVVIPAGGSGTRYSSSVFKLDESLHQLTVLEHSIRPFQNHSSISGIVIAVSQSTQMKYQYLVEKHPKCMLTVGGQSRAHSVHNGFKKIPKDCQYVLIHDAARPNPNEALINRVIEALYHHPVVVPGLPVSDTLKQVSGNAIVKTVDRTSLIAVQTPQGFHYSALNHAYARTPHLDQFTDEAALVEHNGFQGVHVPGDDKNIKITRPNDIRLATIYLSD